MTKHEEANLIRAAHLCLQTPNYRVGFFISNREKVLKLIDFAMKNFNELGIEMIQHTAPAIYFANGSMIVFMIPTNATGWEGHKVWIDEAVDVDVAAYLKTRERLK